MENFNEMSLKEKFYAYQKRVNYFLDPDKYIIAHIDGRSFSKMIKNKFEKPFDDKFIYAMNETAKYVSKEVQGCIFAYTQSDEITLVIKKSKPEGDVFFGGRICKMQSVIASLATSRFSQVMAAERIKETVPTCASPDEVLQMCVDAVLNGPLYQFDCKVFNVDNANDAMGCVLYRNIDCIRNSKQQTCQTYLPHKILMSKNTDEQVELLKTEKGVDWNKFSDDKKFGRIIKKVVITHVLNDNETYERHKWEAFPFFDMTNPEQRENFINEFNLKDDE